MPVVFALAFAPIVGAGSIFSIAGVTFATAEVLGTVAFTATMVGASLALQPKPPSALQTESRVNIRQSDAPRLRGYGLIKTTGVVYFWQPRADSFYLGVAIHSGEIDRVERIHLDGEFSLPSVTLHMPDHDEVNANQAVTLDGLRYDGYTHGMAFYGADDQTNAPTLIIGFTAGVWTTNHRLRGIAHIQIRMDKVVNVGDNPEMYQRQLANGIPDITAIYRASKVWDMRQGLQDSNDPSTWEWSDNPALCILDYLRHDDGGRRGLGLINVDSFEAVADICDQPVQTTSGGPDENRYRLCGAYTFHEEAREVLTRMLDTCDSEIYIDADGLIAIRHNEWQNPLALVRFTEEHIISVQWNAVESAQTGINELHYKYHDAAASDRLFEMVEGVPIRDEALITERGEVLTEQTEYSMVPSPSQAFRLATRKFRRRNPPSTLLLVTDAIGLMAIAEDKVRVFGTRLDLDGVYKIIRHHVEDIHRHEFELSEVTEDMYDDVLMPE